MNIKKLSKQVYQNNKAKGFWEEDREVYEVLFLIKSEVFEMYERFRKHGFDQLIPELGLAINNKEEYKAKYKDSLFTEHADVIIRLLDIIGYFDKDIKLEDEEELKKYYFDGDVSLFRLKTYIYQLEHQISHLMDFTTFDEKLSEVVSPFDDSMHASFVKLLKRCLYVHRTFFEPGYNSVYEKISYNTQRKYKHGKQF